MGLAVASGVVVGGEARGAEPVVGAPNLLPAVPPDPGGTAVVKEPAPTTRAPAPAKPPSLLAPLPGPPAKPAEAYELRRAEDGSGDLLYRAPGFDARIYRDGSVHFTDRHFSFKFFPWMPYRTSSRTPTLQSFLRDKFGQQSAGGGAASGSTAPAGAPGWALRDYGPAPAYAPAMSPFRPDPNEGCRYPKPCFFDAPVVLLSVAGTFDLTDELMRFGGQDPYRYEKARFMKGTAELRSRRAAHAHADDLREASDQLPRRLEEIAANPDLTPPERRATIEALGREMDGATPEGRKARALIDAFVRERFSAAPAARPSPAASPGQPASRPAARPAAP